jgi:cytidylate kinase
VRVSIIVITGIQAAGKSTVAQALAESLPNSVHVRGDLFRRMIVNGRVEMGGTTPEPKALEQLALRYELAAETADRYAQAGFTVVLQDIILGEHLQNVVNHIRSRPLSVVVLAPSVTAVAERDAERQATRGKIAYRPGQADIAMFDEWLRSTTSRIGYWLDTSELSVADTVADIRGHLESSARVA